MKLKNRTLSDIAEMICGNEPWLHFPYRSSSALSSFFRNCDTDYRHDGSTRMPWVREKLEALNMSASTTPNLPADYIVRALQELMEATDYERAKTDRPNVDRMAALADLNKVLAKDGFEVYLDATDRAHVRSTETQQTSAVLDAVNRKHWTPAQMEHRKVVAAYLATASEDDFTEHILVPLFAQLGFLRISVAGHKDKLMEYGKDLWMKYRLPTGHFIYFAAQIKKGKIDAAGKTKGDNVSEVHAQALMAMDHPILDPEVNRKVLLDHVFVIASGEITKPARNLLVEKLDKDGRRRIIFFDRDEILDLATSVNLLLPKSKGARRGFDDNILS